MIDIARKERNITKVIKSKYKNERTLVDTTTIETNQEEIIMTQSKDL